MAEGFNVHVDGDIDERVKEMAELKSRALEAAEEIADIARTTAPVVSSGYVEGLVVQETKHGARVLATADDSAFVEFGVPSQGKEAHFTLRRAVDAAGYRFRGK